ncbi:autotransporter-associated beta strand repeat-containing protein [Microvirga roseola]|uniref:autotransporter-associated beta strand repeat-containing protein n=1 Tax=Microvirga roseola TaxID=2883126 RepID=UPI001E4BBB34|nr:autotransporter-associated beta strand repeat-containing protein [Microvirga roseola]
MAGAHLPTGPVRTARSSHHPIFTLLLSAFASIPALLPSSPALAQRQEVLAGGQVIADPVDLGAPGIAYTVPGLSSDRAAISGRIGGAGPLIKDGGGTLVLQNTLNDYTGATTVRAGTLEGSLSRTTNLTVMSGAIYRTTGTQNIRSLSGEGTIAGAARSSLSVNLNAVPLQVFSGRLSLPDFHISGTGTFVFRGSADFTTFHAGPGSTLRVESEVGQVRPVGGTVQIADGARIGSIYIRGRLRTRSTFQAASEKSASSTRESKATRRERSSRREPAPCGCRWTIPITAPAGTSTRPSSCGKDAWPSTARSSPARSAAAACSGSGSSKDRAFSAAPVRSAIRRIRRPAPGAAKSMSS